MLLMIDDYRRLGDDRSIVDWPEMDEDIEFEPVRLISIPRAAEL